MVEEGFPRGGRKTQPKNDKPKKSGGKGSKSSAEAKKSRFLASDKRMELPSIGYDTIVEGALSLGSVRQVRETSLLISLPGMTAGTVDIKNISAPYTQILEKLEDDKQLADDEVVHALESMFKVGDVVVVKVINVTVKENGKHHVALSLDPHQIHTNWITTDLTENIVMTGAVKSKEDKGYIIDMGIKGVSAFLPMASALHSERKLKKPLGIGQLLSVNICRCEIKRLMAKLTLNSIPNQVKQVTVPDGTKILPGMKSSCIVVKKGGSGFIVSFMDSIIGRIHADHLNGQEIAEVGDTVIGRVLFIPPWDVGPYLSLDEGGAFPYFSDPNSPPVNLPQGESRRRKGLVVNLEPRGAKVKLQGGGAALLKRQRASDKLDYTDEQFKQDFRPGTQHVFRVLEYSALDKTFIVSAQESKVDASNILNLDELGPGTVHKVTIAKYNEGGAVVKLSDIKGFIPYHHLHDKMTMIKVPFLQKKFPEGSTLLAKVFQVDIQKNSVILTAKKLLRRSKGIVASSFDKLEVGGVGHAIVKKVAAKQAGIIVQGIGGVLGFVPRSKIPKIPGDEERSLESRFPIGLGVEFKVLEVDVEKSRAIFTLDVESAPEDEKETVEVKKGKNNNKRKAATNEESVASKKSKKNKTKETPIVEPQSGKKSKKRKLSETSETTEDEPAKGAAKPKKKKNKKKQKKTSTSEDSGIEEDGQKLSTHLSSFWDVTNTTTSDNSVKDEEEEVVEVKSEDEEEEEVKSEIKEENEDEEENESEEEVKLEIVAIKKKEDPNPKERKPPTLFNPKMTEKEYELHLMKSPNDIPAWRQLRLFAIQSGDPAKAVSIIKRILAKIPIQNEVGKREGWLQILQIEVQYGSEGAAKSILEDALKVNDKVVLLEHAARMYEVLEKIQEAEDLYRRRLKMSQQVPNAWINLGQFLYKHGKVDAARQLLPNALHSLSESDQIYVTAKFAKMEIEFGDVEKGRSMFLTICLQRVKRTDLWLLYANSLTKIKEFSGAAEVLKTALGTKKLNPRECRPILKRLVEIEKEHGTPESLQKLKIEAAEFLNITKPA